MFPCYPLRPNMMTVRVKIPPKKLENLFKGQSA